MPVINLPTDFEDPWGDKLRTAINDVNDAVDAAIPAAEKGVANGVATLNSRGDVEILQLSGLLGVDGVRSVLEFGAVGDGITDDTAAVQAAANSGAKAIFYPPGRYRIGGTLTFSSSGQKHFGMAGHSDTDPSAARATLERPSVASVPMITVTGYAVLFSDLGFKNTADSDTSGDVAILFERPAGSGGPGTRDQSIDSELYGLYFSQFHTAVRYNGQGLKADRISISKCRFGFELDFPSDYTVKDSSVQSGPYAGYRMYKFSNIRTHGMNESLILNEGQFASYIRAIKVSDVVIDHFGQLFRGALSNGMISDVVANSGTAGLIRLSADSHDFVIDNVHLEGRPAVEDPFSHVTPTSAMPLYFLDATGNLSNFTISNVYASYLRENFISLSGSVHAGRISNIHVREWGRNTPSSIIASTQTDIQIHVDGVTAYTSTAQGTWFDIGSSDASTIDVKITGVAVTPGSYEQWTADIRGGLVVNGTAIATPTAGTWRAGDIVTHRNPSSVTSGGAIAWICTVSGSPGTWITYQTKI